MLCEKTHSFQPSLHPHLQEVRIQHPHHHKCSPPLMGRAELATPHIEFFNCVRNEGVAGVQGGGQGLHLGVGQWVGQGIGHAVRWGQHWGARQ